MPTLVRARADPSCGPLAKTSVRGRRGPGGDVCIPPSPPELDCNEVEHTDFTVIKKHEDGSPGGDPHNFLTPMENGIGCGTPVPEVPDTPEPEPEPESPTVPEPEPEAQPDYPDIPQIPDGGGDDGAWRRGT